MRKGIIFTADAALGVAIAMIAIYCAMVFMQSYETIQPGYDSISAMKVAHDMEYEAGMGLGSGDAPPGFEDCTDARAYAKFPEITNPANPGSAEKEACVI
jgi:hypothetical protein